MAAKRTLLQIVGQGQCLKTIICTVAIAGLMIACQTADPVELAPPDATLENDSTGGASPLDSQLMDMSNFGSDMQVDGALCSVRESQCANGLDDDCDGQVDECGVAETCQNGVCAADESDEGCHDHLDCEPSSVCLNSTCEAIRLNSCGDSEQCLGEAQCSTVDNCEAGARCYGTWTAPCETTCQCTGLLFCADASASCVECVNGGQCDSAETCGVNGLCTRVIDVGMEPSAAGLINLISGELMNCIASAEAKKANGCVALNYSGEMAPDNRADLTNALESALTSCEQVADTKLRTIMGCDDSHGHLWLKDPLEFKTGSFACFSFLPYPPAFAPAPDTWLIVVDDCNVESAN
ncbi:MAG: hypothetical protein CMH52_10025 [Myxococcales bacterium]|nr:hypothetical protein [Myxococcales bacterium]